MTLKVRILRLSSSHGLPLPDYQSAEAAGCDLIAAVPAGADTKLLAGARALIPTGICLEMPSGYEAQVRPRSGLAIKLGVTVLNAPGTIDSDYRGEICVMLINHGTEPVVISRGMRIAQLIFAPVSRAAFIEVDTLGESARGAGGFGSTGADSSHTKTLQGTRS